MFDKLIESNSAEAEFKPRRKFFMVSSVVVGILFITAVVASLYAQDLNLGTDNFELVEMIAPPDADAPKPEPPRQQQQQNQNQQTSELPTRTVNMARVDEATHVPDTISTTQNTDRSRPANDFILNPNAVNSDGVGRPDGSEHATMGTSSAIETPEAQPTETREPPPIAKSEPKKHLPQTKGVVNGFAVSLPKPPYPPVAVSMNLTGTVNVQVLIDESGDVVSAKAVDGHPFFRQPAERAARMAKFKPTLLGTDPVKVTGVIVYRFTR